MGMLSALRTGLALVVSGALLVAPLALAGPSGAVAQAAGKLPKRTVSSTIVETEDNRLIFRGNVSPGHARKPVLIQKRGCLKPRCDWHLFKKVRTKRKGGFHARVTAPRKGYDYWRAKVRRHDGYRTSYSEVWRTYVV